MNRKIANCFTIAITIVVIAIVLQETLKKFVSDSYINLASLVISCVMGATIAWFFCVIYYTKKEEKKKGGES